MVTNIIITIKPTQQSLTLHGLAATIIITTNIIIIIKLMQRLPTPHWLTTTLTIINITNMGQLAQQSLTLRWLTMVTIINNAIIIIIKATIIKIIIKNAIIIIKATIIKTHVW